MIPVHIYLPIPATRDNSELILMLTRTEYLMRVLNNNNNNEQWLRQTNKTIFTETEWRKERKDRETSWTFHDDDTASHNSCCNIIVHQNNMEKKYGKRERRIKCYSTEVEVRKKWITKYIVEQWQRAESLYEWERWYRKLWVCTHCSTTVHAMHRTVRTNYIIILLSFRHPSNNIAIEYIMWIDSRKHKQCGYRTVLLILTSSSLRIDFQWRAIYVRMCVASACMWDTERAFPCCCSFSILSTHFMPFNFSVTFICMCDVRCVYDPRRWLIVSLLYDRSVRDRYCSHFLFSLSFVGLNARIINHIPTHTSREQYSLSIQWKEMKWKENIKSEWNQKRKKFCVFLLPIIFWLRAVDVLDFTHE